MTLFTTNLPSKWISIRINSNSRGRNGETTAKNEAAAMRGSKSNQSHISFNVRSYKSLILRLRDSTLCRGAGTCSRNL